MEVVSLQKSTFDSFIRDNPVAVVLIYADWDPRSKIMQRHMREVAKDADADMNFGQISIDDPAMTQTLVKIGIMTTPTFLIYRKAALINLMIGFFAVPDLVNKIQEALHDPVLIGSNHITLSPQPANDDFDWSRTLDLAPDTPTSHFALQPLMIVEDQSGNDNTKRLTSSVYDLETHAWIYPKVELWHIATQAYAVVRDRRAGGFRDNGPFVYYLLWAPSAGAARRVVFEDAEHDDWLIAEPPAALLLKPTCTNYECIRTEIQGQNPGQERDGYSFDATGRCIGRVLRANKRHYHFRTTVDDPAEKLYAIVVDARQ